VSFKLSEKSSRTLDEVHPDLKTVVEFAIGKTEVDFSAFEGMRTAARQAALVKAGASRTLNSRHLTGHAVDLVAYVEFRLSWDWPLYYSIAKSVHEASTTLAIPIRWGGVWDRLLSDLNGEDLESEVLSYQKRQRLMGKKAFVDGPHFELPRELYP